MSEKIPSNKVCAVCGRVFTPGGYGSDGSLEWIDITSHSDRFRPGVPAHECPAKYFNEPTEDR